MVGGTTRVSEAGNGFDRGGLVRPVKLVGVDALHADIILELGVGCQFGVTFEFFSAC